MKKYMPKPGIIGDNFDEVFLIGTEEELRKFAQSILDFIEKSKETELMGYKVCTASLGLTDNLCEICLDGLVITNNENGKECLINFYLENNGSIAIDWEERKKCDFPSF